MSTEADAKLIGPPTKEDYGVAILVLKKAGTAAATRALLADDVHGTDMQAAEAAARIVVKLRELRDAL